MRATRGTTTMLDEVTLRIKYDGEYDEYVVETVDYHDGVTNYGSTKDEMRLSSLVMTAARDQFDAALEMRELLYEGDDDDE